MNPAAETRYNDRGPTGGIRNPPSYTSMRSIPHPISPRGTDTLVRSIRKEAEPGLRRACLRVLLAVLAISAGGCAPRQLESPAVTAYISLDEPYARPILEAFTRETGVRVRPVYDTEANKSRGLALRIQSEMARPRADVFWSSELMQMLSLRRAGALEAYRSPSAEGIPKQYRDPDGYWTGFAARMRVLLVNTQRCGTPPSSVLELTDPRWKGETAMADPLFGSSTTEAVALFQVLGPDNARAYYRARRANGTRVTDGNSVAAEAAARGDVMVAQTDGDDAFIRADGNKPLKVSFPDQAGLGMLEIPNTAALIKDGPHAAQGRQFLDYLLRPETELLLANLPSRQLPLHTGLSQRLPAQVRPIAAARKMKVNYSRFLEGYDEVDRFLRETFQH